jgi:hypothetical protein
MGAVAGSHQVDPLNLRPAVQIGRGIPPAGGAGIGGMEVKVRDDPHESSICGEDRKEYALKNVFCLIPLFPPECFIVGGDYSINLYIFIFTMGNGFIQHYSLVG